MEDIRPIIKEEIEKVLMNIMPKDGKVTEIDEIPVELLKQRYTNILLYEIITKNYKTVDILK